MITQSVKSYNAKNKQPYYLNYGYLTYGKDCNNIASVWGKTKKESISNFKKIIKAMKEAQKILNRNDIYINPLLQAILPPKS